MSRLVELFHATGAFKQGDFTLASGAKSPYYVDCKLASLHPEALHLMCAGIEDIIEKRACGRNIFEAVGGMTLGADAIVGGLVRGAYQRGADLTGYIIRQEPKGHGTRRWIEGPLRRGQHTVLVEDVATTGSSLMRAASRVWDYGCSVAFAVAVVDRQEGASELLGKHRMQLFSLLTLNDLIK